MTHDALGRVAHEAFREWAVRCVKPDCFDFYNIAWDSLPERQREAYRVVAEAVATTSRGGEAERSA